MRNKRRILHPVISNIPHLFMIRSRFILKNFRYRYLMRIFPSSSRSHHHGRPDFTEFCSRFKNRYLFICPNPFRFGQKVHFFDWSALKSSSVRPVRLLAVVKHIENSDVLGKMRTSGSHNVKSSTTHFFCFHSVIRVFSSEIVSIDWSESEQATKFREKALRCEIPDTYICALPCSESICYFFRQ